MDRVELRYYWLRFDGRWWVDFDSLERAITERTRAVIAVNPNNPTGSYLRSTDVERLSGICAERGVALIVDEVFGDYAIEGPPCGTIDKSDVIVLSGLSNIVGLPQMKLGWIVAPEEWMARLQLIADTYLSVSAPVQNAAARLLGMRERFQAGLLDRLRSNLAELRRLVAGSPCEVLDVEGGWSAILRLPRTKSEEGWVTEFLEKGGVLVQPGYFFDFESEAYAVVSLLTPGETLREGVTRVMERIIQ
jgi:aspartate/methionine/tyrosine aminotransferase